MLLGGKFHKHFAHGVQSPEPNSVSCPLTKFDGGLQELNRAGSDALEWLNNMSP